MPICVGSVGGALESSMTLPLGKQLGFGFAQVRSFHIPHHVAQKFLIGFMSAPLGSHGMRSIICRCLSNQRVIMRTMWMWSPLSWKNIRRGRGIFYLQNSVLLSSYRHRTQQCLAILDKKGNVMNFFSINFFPSFLVSQIYELGPREAWKRILWIALLILWAIWW